MFSANTALRESFEKLSRVGRGIGDEQVGVVEGCRVNGKEAIFGYNIRIE